MTTPAGGAAPRPGQAEATVTSDHLSSGIEVEYVCDGDDLTIPESVGPYAAAASWLWSRGWRGVIPLPLGQKSPPPDGCTGQNGVDPSWPDVQAWIDGPEGTGNIALRLPDGVIGLDVDNYAGKSGGETLAQAVKSYGPLPATWTITSRSDGVSGIKLFQVPAGRTWASPGAGVDIIRREHRYAVCPPSVHPEGRVYKIVGPDGEPTDMWPSSGDLPELPEPWVAVLDRGPLIPVPAGAALPSGDARQWLADLPGAGDAPDQTMSDALTEAVGPPSGGSRHDHMCSRVMDLVRLGERGHPGVLNAIRAHRAHFIAEVTRPSSHGTTERTDRQAATEFDSALTSACRKIAAAPSEKPTPLPPSLQAQADAQIAAWGAGSVKDWATATCERAVDASTPAVTPAPVDSVPVPVPLAEFLSVADEPVTYRIDGLLPTGGRALLAAQFKSGKTTAMGNLTRALADGDDFLGRRTYPARTILVDDEMHEGQMRRWLRDQDVQCMENVRVVSLRGRVSTFDICDPARRAEWVQVLDWADVLIIDCLRPILDALRLSEDKDAGRFLVDLDALLRAAGIGECVLVHHMGHSGERSRGDSRLRDWPDVEWRLVRQDDEPSSPRFFTAFGRDVDVPETALVFDPVTRRLTAGQGSRADAQAMEVLPDVLRTLKSGPLSRAKVEAALKDRHPQKVIRRSLDLGLKQGSITEDSGPRGARICSLSKAPRHLVTTSSTPSDELAEMNLGTSSPRTKGDELTRSWPLVSEDRQETTTSSPPPSDRHRYCLIHSCNSKPVDGTRYCARHANGRVA